MDEFRLQKTGSTGPQTELLQLGLTRAGHELKKDGVFGPLTRSAVVSFQRRAGLEPDGVAGPLTWAALRPYLTGYVRHTVRRGDTMYDLALRYGVRTSAIEIANPGVDPRAMQIGSELTIPLRFTVVPGDIRFTSLVMALCAEGLCARYPFLRPAEAGHSVLGRPIFCLAAGTGGRQIFYNGTHHANEWITAPLTARFLEEYAAAYAEGTTVEGLDVREAWKRVTLFVAPLVDPDGADLVTGEIASGGTYTSASSIAAEYPEIPFPNGWKANISGTDLNLQYPAGWEEAREIKFAQGFRCPAPRDFVGTAPLSAPESRGIYTLTREHDFALTISYHTQGRVIYWKYGDREPDGARALAERFALLSGYSVEDVPYASGFAGYKDWFIDAYDRPGFTIEAGQGTPPLPLSSFPAMYAENRRIMAAGVAWAAGIEQDISDS